MEAEEGEILTHETSLVVAKVSDAGPPALMSTNLFPKGLKELMDIEGMPQLKPWAQL